MENWYCREPISSTLAASHLVFNIENCVDVKRVIRQRPTRPPDSTGRECYVYVLDGSCVKNIRDLPIDDLAPWNSKMCKSSTRFNAVSINPEKGDMVMRRYIVSDTDNVPECLLACYYCKHPTFKLAKKIFYACDGRREACLPGSFVVFIYEFDGPETLYQRAYQNGSANRQGSGPRRHLVDPNRIPPNVSSINSKNSLNLNNKKNSSFLNICNDISQTRFALETAFNNGNNNLANVLSEGLNNGNGLGNGLDETLSQLFSNDSKLNELFQYSQMFAENNTQSSIKALQPFMRKNNLNNGLNNNSSGAKRRKVSNNFNFGRQNNQFNCAKPEKPSFFENNITDFRCVFASKLMIENFEKNGLIESENFIEFCDKFNESSFENFPDIGKIKLGGCVLLDETFSVGKYFLTVLWFRNPTFLFREEPVIHPIAILVSSKIEPDDYEFLLKELQTKITVKNKIARAILAPENINIDSFSTPSLIFPYPCLRLICAQNFQNSILKQFPQEANVLQQIFKEDLFGEKLDAKDAKQSTGILNSLKFEEFVKKLGQVERKWPTGFRTWFREKSGWVFERLSLGSRMKAGFKANLCASLEKLVTPVKDGLSRRFESLILNSDFSMENAVDVLDELTNEILIHSAQAIFDETPECSANLTNDEKLSKNSNTTSKTKVAIIEEEDEEDEMELGVNQNEKPSTSINTNSKVQNTQKKNSDCKKEMLETNEKKDIILEKNFKDQKEPKEIENDKIILHSSLCSLFKFSRLEWLKLKDKREILKKIGLSSIPICELSLHADNGLNPNLFIALTRQERMDLLNKAHELEVRNFEGKPSTSCINTTNNTQVNDDDERKFIVIDNAGKSFFYVSGNYEINATYCQCQKQKISNFSTALIKTLICEHLCAVALIDPDFAKTLKNTFLPNTANDLANKEGGVFEEIMTENNDRSSSTDLILLSKGLQLAESPSVEIIRCSTHTESAVNSETNNSKFTSNKNGNAIKNNRNNSVDSIIESLQNKVHRQNELTSSGVTPPLLEPYDFSDINSSFFSVDMDIDIQNNGKIDSEFISPGLKRNANNNNNNNNNNNKRVKIENEIFNAA